MTNNEKPFYVEKADAYWSNDRFETLADAEAYARRLAYSSGNDFGIFQLIATAKQPEQVNTVKIEKVS